MNVYGNVVGLVQDLITLRDSRQFRALDEMLASVGSDAEVASLIEDALTALRELEEVAFHANEYLDANS